MTAAQALADRVLRNVLESQEDEVASLDFLRAIRQQADLLYETEHVREQLRADPFDHFEKIWPRIERLGQALQVTDVQRTATLSGYSYIDANVRIPSWHKKKKPPSPPLDDDASYLQLSFRYEREAVHPVKRQVRPDHDPPTVCYSIDVAYGSGPKNRLLWVQVWADGNQPSSHLKPVSLDADDNDDDGWEDMSDQEECEQESKRLRCEATVEAPREEQTNGNSNNQRAKKAGENGEANGSTTQNEQSDRYSVDMDPEIVHQFLEWTGLGAINEDTAFFLLMTFPFYEVEWDLVDFVLSNVFGYESDKDGVESLGEH